MTYLFRERRSPKRDLILLFILVLCLLITVYSVKQNEELYGDPIVMRFHAVDNNISCHYILDNDALPSAEAQEFSPKPNSFFFHETSCSGGLNSRQACAVESAARAHPRREVYVLFSGPVSNYVLKRSNLAKLRSYPNVRVARVHINEYVKDTPLEDLVQRNVINDSQWRVEHTSDILRYVTLYKYGGVYLDTDVVVVKSFSPLGHNWVAKQDSTEANSAIIAISMDHLGQKLAREVMNEVKNTYRPDLWAHNGPGAFTRVLKNMCYPAHQHEWSAKSCQGLEVYGPDYFYPVHYSNYGVYFEPTDPEFLGSFDNAYAHHFWNKLSHNHVIKKNSPYALIASNYCPTIYEMYGDEFGF